VERGSPRFTLDPPPAGQRPARSLSLLPVRAFPSPKCLLALSIRFAFFGWRPELGGSALAQQGGRVSDAHSADSTSARSRSAGPLRFRDPERAASGRHHCLDRLRRPASVRQMEWPASTITHPRLTAKTIASAVIPGNSSNMRHCRGKPSVESYKARTSCKASDSVSRSGGDDTVVDHLAAIERPAPAKGVTGRASTCRYIRGQVSDNRGRRQRARRNPECRVGP